MKKIILVLALLTTSSAFAVNEWTMNFGFQSSALNAGVTYAKIEGNTGFGGYLLHQTEKESASISPITSFGGLYKINFVQSSVATVYVAPGFGLSMVKVSTVDPLTATVKKSDKNVLGASLKLGAQHKFSPTVALGTNWFDSDAGGSTQITTGAITFNY
jgi:hypothetical protein